LWGPIKRCCSEYTRYHSGLAPEPANHAAPRHELWGDRGTRNRGSSTSAAAMRTSRFGLELSITFRLAVRVATNIALAAPDRAAPRLRLEMRISSLAHRVDPSDRRQPIAARGKDRLHRRSLSFPKAPRRRTKPTSAISKRHHANRFSTGAFDQTVQSPFDSFKAPSYFVAATLSFRIVS
jgi:hypothetical protein